MTLAGAVTPMRTENRFTWVFVWKLQLAGCCEARTFSTPAEVHCFGLIAGHKKTIFDQIGDILRNRPYAEIRVRD